MGRGETLREFHAKSATRRGGMQVVDCSLRFFTTEFHRLMHRFSQNESEAMYSIHLCEFAVYSMIICG